MHDLVGTYIYYIIGMKTNGVTIYQLWMIEKKYGSNGINILYAKMLWWYLQIVFVAVLSIIWVTKKLLAIRHSMHTPREDLK